MRERFTTHRKKSRSKRIQKSRKRVLPLKAQAVIQMRLSRCVCPMERCEDMSRTENRSLHSPTSPVYISAPPSTTTSRRSTFPNVGSIRSPTSISRQNSLAAVSAVRHGQEQNLDRHMEPATAD